MTDNNVFGLAQLIVAAGDNPDDITDAIWAAGYRQPERTAAEAAELTIATFHYCMSYGMPEEFWPKNYDAVLINELMAAVMADQDSLCDIAPITCAHSVLNAGFSKEPTHG